MVNDTPIGLVFMKGASVFDSKGNEVFCGDKVVDSFLTEHTVLAIEPIPDTDCAFIIDQEKRRLVPHLTEKVG